MHVSIPCYVQYLWYQYQQVISLQVLVSEVEVHIPTYRFHTYNACIHYTVLQYGGQLQQVTVVQWSDG